MPLFEDAEEERHMTVMFGALIFAMKFDRHRVGDTEATVTRTPSQALDEAEAFMAEAKRRYGG